MSLLLVLATEGQRGETPPILVTASARLAPREEQTWRFNLPSWGAEQAVVLELEARLEATRLAGSTVALGLWVNGQVLEPEQLVNKPLTFQTRNGTFLTWFGTMSWRVVYSPDFAAADTEETNPYYVLGGRAYRFVFDLTDLVHPGENRLLVRHSVPSIDNPLLLRNVRVRIVSAAEIGRRPKGREGPLPVYAPQGEHRVDYTLAWFDGGGFAVTVNGETFQVETVLSVPGGAWNHLRAGPRADGEEGWRVQVERRGGRRCTVTATGSRYRLRREVRGAEEWVEVTDTLTNTSGTDLGLQVRHLAHLAEGEPTGLYLSGLPSPLAPREVKTRGNPTVLLLGQRAALGLLPLDDVFRVHAYLTYDAGRAGLLDPGLGRPPGESITLRWRLHPVVRQLGTAKPQAEYWTFLNSVRRGLGVNFTVEGGFAFLSTAMFHWDDEQLAKWLRVRDLKFVSGTIGKRPDGRYAHGTAFLTTKKDHARWRELFARVKRLQPGIKCLMYFHAFISTEDGAPEKYADSRMTNSRGDQMRYPYRYPLPLFYATLDNAYGRVLPRYFEVIFEDLGGDGVYWDEMAYSAQVYTYDRWDGVSVDLHPRTLEIVRKKAATPLLCQSWKVQQVERILGAGKVLIANGPPRTETMSRYHFPRFQETGTLANIARGHLYTPIGLGDHLTQRTEQDVVSQIRRNMDYGGLYYYYVATVPQTHENLTARMFPFTPLELHQGVLLGEERILTNRWGLFGWNDASGHEVHVYDAEGREVKRGEEALVRTFTREGQTWTELRLPARWVAVIERR